MYMYGKMVIGLSITTLPYMYIVYLTLCYHIPVFDMDYERIWNLYLKRVNGAVMCNYEIITCIHKVQEK